MSQKKIGLALSGGGARGFAHVGVLKALVENNIPISHVAGTSVGSIVGAAFAAGMSIGEITAMSRRVSWQTIVRPSLSPTGILSSAPMARFLKRELPVENFEELKIPYAVVACDFASGQASVFKDSGDLIFAVRASCALPGVFAPLKNNSGKVFVDGGVVSQIPVEAVREMGADVVIAVDLIGCGATFRANPRTALGVLIQSAMTMLRRASRAQCELADLVITPQIAHIRPDRLRDRDECLRLGEEAALAEIDRIKKLI